MSDLQTPPPGSPLPPNYPHNPGPYGPPPGPGPYGQSSYPGYGFPPPQQKPPNRRGLIIAIGAAVIAVVVAIVLAVVLVSGSSSPTEKASSSATAAAPAPAALSPELAQGQTCGLYRSTKQADDALSAATPIPADWNYRTPGVLPLLDKYANQSIPLQRKLLSGIPSETPDSVATPVREYAQAMLARAQNFLERGATTDPATEVDRATLVANAVCGS